jgi:hypothetical protein
MLCGARYNLSSKGVVINDAKMIAELNFGFWTTILASKDKKYTNMWRKIFNEVFPNYKIIKSVDNDKLDIAKVIDNIRQFRNRIFHYEPIFNQTNLNQIHSDIIEILGWINKDLQALTISFDEFNLIKNKEEHIKKELDKKFT